MKKYSLPQINNFVSTSVFFIVMAVAMLVLMAVMLLIGYAEISVINLVLPDEMRLAIRSPVIPAILGMATLVLFNGSCMFFLFTKSRKNNIK